MARPTTLYRAPKGATLLEGPKLTAAEIAAGTAPKLREAGRMLDCTATMAAEPIIRKEWSEAACSSAEVKRTYPEKEISVSCSLRSAAEAKNILLAWQGGSKNEVGGSSISDESSRDDIAQGDCYVLALPSDGISLVVTDSNGSPVTLVEGTDWEWMNGSAQIVRMIGDLSGYTLPLKYSYDTALSTEIGVMNNMGVGRHLVVQATNSENDCTQEMMELYNCMPDGDFEDILGVAPDATDENPLVITFTASAHPDMPADPDLGTIGRIIR